MVEGITQKLIDKNRADIQFGADKAGAPSRLRRRSGVQAREARDLAPGAN